LYDDDDLMVRTLETLASYPTGWLPKAVSREINRPTSHVFEEEEEEKEIIMQCKVTYGAAVAQSV
jgi:hypothetical protein